jgi:hypothetical protein
MRPLNLVLVLSLAACDDEPAREPVTPELPDPPAAAAPTDVVTEPEFEIRATPGGPYAAGVAGELAITLVPGSGWHVNEEYVFAVEVHAPAALAVAKPSLGRADAAEFGEDRARWNVAFTPASAGEHRVDADVDFAVCDGPRCLFDERTVSLVVAVR